MREDAVPKIEWEIAVCAAEAGDKVVFERADGAFGCVSSMDMGRGELEVHLGAVHELLQGFGGFIVESLEAWSEAAGG